MSLGNGGKRLSRWDAGVKVLKLSKFCPRLPGAGEAEKREGSESF